MLGKVLSERHSGRKFERASRWNTVEYTIVSRKNRFAEFADNYNDGSDKLNMTWFKVNNTMLPVNRFIRLESNIILDDYSTLTSSTIISVAQKIKTFLFMLCLHL